MSITAALAADKEPFKAAPAASYAHHQTNAQVTIGVEPFMTEEQVKSAFGKLKPYEHGILPVLVVIQNDSDKTIRIDRMRVEYAAPNGTRVEATPAKDIRYLRGGQRPKTLPGPKGPIPIKGKNPLDAWEIEGRAMAAQMITAGQSASGFFYFQTGLQPGATIYLSGITEAASGKEFIFFEIPLK